MPPGADAPTDDDLAERAKAGELDAFNLLVERYQRPVFGLCVRMLSSAAAAEDTGFTPACATRKCAGPPGPG